MPYSNEQYIYGMSRPPMYGTCPIEFTELTQAELPDDSVSGDFYPFLVSYNTPLSDEEQKKWEMRPVSPSAYKWQVGGLIEGKYPLRITRHLINWNYDCENIVDEDSPMRGRDLTQRRTQWELLERLERNND